MNNLKNLAGSDVSIFLFRFEIHGNAISFVVNQEIGMDMDAIPNVVYKETYSRRGF
jgi:hypothetical protein